MLTISPPAYERLSEMLSHRPREVAVRIVLRRGRARLRPGRQRTGDKTVEHNGRTVLLLDQSAARYVDRRTLGVRETNDGPRLRLRRSRREGTASEN